MICIKNFLPSKLHSEDIILPTKGMVIMRNGFTKFITGKGFYLALAVCLAAAGTAAWFAVDSTIKNIESAPMEKTPVPHTEEKLDIPAPAEEKLENILQEPPVKKPQEVPVSKPETPPKETKPESTESKEKSPSSSSESEKEFSIMLPVSGSAVASFSGNMLVKNETLNDWRTHNGIDLGAPKGTPVVSACEGVVSDIRSDPMWGNVVEVTSGEYTLTYAGLEKIMAEPEMKLSAGQQIGTIGSVPCEISLEPHLHFDVKKSGKYVDPVSLAK